MQATRVVLRPLGSSQFQVVHHIHILETVLARSKQFACMRQRKRGRGDVGRTQRSHGRAPSDRDLSESRLLPIGQPYQHEATASERETRKRHQKDSREHMILDTAT